MVTKLYPGKPGRKVRSVLAKILMVTKLGAGLGIGQTGSVLAKILMVTKQCYQLDYYS